MTLATARCRRMLGGGVLCSLVPFADAMSQRIGGMVKEAGTGIPIAGAVVSAIDAAGSTATRTITNENGRFEVQWRTSLRRLRVVRIGYRPASVELVPNAARDTTIDIVMSRIPVMLDTIRAKKDATCSNSPDRVAALDLWEQARAALLASVVARTDNPGEMTLLSYDRRYDPGNERTTRLRMHMTTGTSRVPYFARAPALLAALGYTTKEGTDRVFYAPDADVLLDDTFAALHCLGVKLDGARPGQIGMTFEPASARGRDSLVDVRGVLWLDSRVPALVELEFTFTNVSSQEERAGAGGTIHFQSMPNGVVFIDRWTMLLPLFDTGIRQPRLTALNEAGGAVVFARWQNGMSWRTPMGTVQGQVTERQTKAPIAGAMVIIDGMIDTVTTDSEGRYLLSLIPPGKYALQIVDTAMAQFFRGRVMSQEVRVARSDTATANVEFTAHATLAAEQCKGQRDGTETSTILGRVDNGGGSWPRNLVVESSWNADFVEDGSTGAVIGTKRAHQVGSVDDQGRFFVCGVVRERPIQLRILVGKVLVTDTTIRLGRDDLVGHIAWTLRPGRLTGASSGGESTLSGRVVRDGDGSPIADAEVWAVLGGVRVRTDSAGRFRFFGLKSGTEVVQVRQIGYTMKTDTITLRQGGETTRQLRMRREVATMLDTMRSTVDSVHFLSPTMRAFEARRARGIGHFIAEDELRKNDTRSIDNVMLKDMPIRFVPDGSKTYAASTRGIVIDIQDPKRPKPGLPCLVRVMLDGVLLYNGPPEAPFDIGKIRVSDLAGVEFYSGGSTTPVQFAAVGSNDCGLLLLWTRER